MASARGMRLRIKSVRNISQVTRALEAVSAAKVRKSVQAVTATCSYATKAWQVLTHVAAQPGRQSLHPLLTERSNPKSALAIVITSDRGLAGAYNTNVIRFILQNFDKYRLPVKYIAVGRKGRDLMSRIRKPVIAEFSNLPATPAFSDVSAIGRLAVDEFQKNETDEVYWCIRSSLSIGRQTTGMKKLLPLEVKGGEVGSWTMNSTAALWQPMNMSRTCTRSWMRSFHASRLCKSIKPSLSRKRANMLPAWSPCTMPPRMRKIWLRLTNCSTTGCVNKRSRTISWI